MCRDSKIYMVTIFTSDTSEGQKFHFRETRGCFAPPHPLDIVCPPRICRANDFLFSLET